MAKEARASAGTLESIRPPNKDFKLAKAMRGRPFAKGRSGNPAGRPPGSRNATTLAAEALLLDQAEALTRKVVEMALSGDKFALSACFDRILPRARDRIVTFTLPPLVTVDDAAKTIAALLTAVAGGELSPAEAGELGHLVDAFTRATVAVNLERGDQEDAKGNPRVIVQLEKGLERL